MRLSKITSSAISDSLPKHDVTPAGKITVELGSGERGTVDASDLDEVLKTGGRAVSKEEIQKEEKFAEAGESPGLAFAAGTLRDATFGLSDQLITKTGMATPEDLRLLEEANPNATTLGQVVGTVAPILLSGGTTALGKVASAAPVVLAEKAGFKLGSKIAGKALSETTSNVVKNAIKTGLGSSIDAGLYGAGQVISEDALGKAEFNAENLLASVAKNALLGGATGGAFGALTPSALKTLEKGKLKADKFLTDVANKGDIGILKWAGADKKEFGKIFKRADLDEKQVVDHVLSLTKGGGDDLGGLVTTSIDDVYQKNDQFLADAGSRMDSAIDAVDSEFNSVINTSDPEMIKKGLVYKDGIIYGEDLAKMIEDGPLKEIGDIITPRKEALQKFANDLREMGVQKDHLGNIQSIKPLSPSQLKRQSIEFGNLAKFDAATPTATREAYAQGRFLLEDKLTSLMNSLDGGRGLADAYKIAKKDYAKGKLTEEILENGLKKLAANNRGMSLTEGLSAATGAAIGGLPGAIAGYGLRKLSRDQGDKVASFVLRKIEKANNSGKINISGAVDGFINAGSRAAKFGQKAATRSALSKDPRSEKELEEKASYYSQDPLALVNKFNEANEDLIAVAPKTAEIMQDRILKSAQFLGSKLPKQDESPFQDTPKSRSELMKFKNYVDAVENPYEVLEDLKQGYFTPESAEVFQVIYPEIYSEIRNEFMNRSGEFKGLKEKHKGQLSRLLQIDSRKAYTPQGFATLQGVSAQGVQKDLASQMPGAQKPNSGKVPVTAAKNINASNRTQGGIDKVLYRS